MIRDLEYAGILPRVREIKAKMVEEYKRTTRRPLQMADDASRVGPLGSPCWLASLPPDLPLIPR